MEAGVKLGEAVTIPEAAKRLGKSKMTLYRWKEAGRISWVEFGGVLFIPVSEIERLKNEQAAGDEAAA